MDCMMRIKENYDLLSKNEKKIADYICENSVDAYDLSINDLAKKCGQTQSCIVRFTKKIGYSGYTQFRIDLAKTSENLFVNSMDIIENISKANNVIEMSDRVNDFYVNTVNKTFQYLNHPQLDKAITLIKNARKIAVVGEGASLLVGMDLCRKFMFVGMDSVFYDDGPTQLTLVNNLTPEDCVIAISYSGKSNIANQAIKHANEKKIPNIAICQSSKSYMAKRSVVSLFVPSLETERKIGSIASRISCLVVTDLLYLGVVQEQLDKVKGNIAQVRRLLGDLKVG